MIRQILDNLPKADKNKLLYAFEHGLEQYVELDNNKFVGVHTDTIKHLTPTESTGAWSYGTIKKGSE